ncbi:hypothetical protein K3495_g6428 [Podosphaera aphanis]|nr:hypothetical protein K3495_g6428 [Podosphaera aphanis]
MAEKGILQSLRKALRSVGVNVKKDEVVVCDTLAEMIGITKFPPWTEEKIKKPLKDKLFEFTSVIDLLVIDLLVIDLLVIDLLVIDLLVIDLLVIDLLVIDLLVIDLLVKSVLQIIEKRFEQFVAEYEGDEPDDIPDNNLDNDKDFDILIAGLELHYPSSDETFLTSAGPIDGNCIISKLADRSFLHGITGKLEINQPPTIRYGSLEFYRIMIDTRAAKKSKAGYNQYLAFNQMTGTEIDNSTAGKAKISLGMGSVESIAIQKAMEEIGKLRAQKQIADALNQRNGNSGRGGNWKVPYKFLGIDGETCKILLPSGTTHFRSTSVKPFFWGPIDAETNTARNKNVITAPAISEHENNEFSAVPNVEPEPQQQPRRSERQRVPRKLPYDDHLPADISVQLQLNDPNKALTTNAYSLTFTESKRKEIDGLMEKGVFEVVPINSVPKGTRIFNSRFVNEIKNPGTDKAAEKSRLVVQAYKDNGKISVLTQSPTIQRVSQRIILLIAACLRNEIEGINLYLRDISQAYVQSTTSLTRKFFVRPPIDIELPPGTVWQAKRPLYGIPEAGNHSYNIYHQLHLHLHLQKLNMIFHGLVHCFLK